MKVCCRTAPSTHRARCAPMAEPALCVSLHDVAPATWPACRRLLAKLDGIGPLPVRLLVVPAYHHLDERVPGSRPLDWLQRRVYTAGEGEFAALAAADAHHRLLRGWDMLTRRLHWPIAGFVAPAWLLGPGARAALTQLPFRYTTTLRSIYRLPDWHETAAPSLVYSVRSAWRRALSRRWNRWLYSRSANLPLLRAGLHPADADHPNVVDDWCALLQRALEQRRPLTKRDWVEGACGAAMPHC